jgi:hypothetical protein
MMGSITPINDIQAQLSYSYFHAVVARVGGEVMPAPRLVDNMGLDVILKIKGRFSKRPIKTDFTIGAQLKSTSRDISILENGLIPFSKLNRNTYDMFRSHDRPHPYLMILFCLPKDKKQWLEVTPDNMILRKCTYWVDLYKASASRAKSPTIYFPVKNLFTNDQFENIILRRYAESKEVPYEF